MLKTVIINVLLALLFAELTLGTYYSQRSGSFISARALFDKNFVFDLDLNSDCPWSKSVSLHPYLSFYYKVLPGCTEQRNRHGFIGPEIPLEYSEDFYTLLLTGASVAEQIAQHKEEESGPQYYLEYYLNKHWQSPKRKPFRVISSAVAAAHQPITYFQSVLFMKVADHVISLEGYNEHFRAQGEELIENPQHYWTDLRTSATNPGTYYLIEGLGRLVRVTKKSFLKNSYTLYFLLTKAMSTAQEKWQQLRNQDTTFPAPPADWSAEKKKEFYLQSYQHYLTLNYQLLSANSKAFTLFLQPYPGKGKTLTAEERSAVGSLDQRGYEEVKAAAQSLATRKKLHIENLEKVFESSSTETLYVDHIHTNRAGVKILAEAMARRLAERYQWKKIKRSH